MKKIIFILFGILVVLAMNAQNLPNVGFENWTNEFLYVGLDEWNSSNNLGSTDFSGIIQSEDAYSGDYAIRLEPRLDGEDTIFNFVYHGTVTEEPTGGMAYSDEFDQVKGFYKCNMPEVDSATIYIIKWYGATPSEVIAKVGGVHETWTEFTVDVVGGTCDSVFVGFISSDIIIEANIEFDSWVMFDSIYFYNTLGDAPSQIPNHDMENWTNYELLDLDDWYTLNPMLYPLDMTSATRSEDAYNGMYSVELTGFGIYEDTIPGFLSLGEITFDDIQPFLGVPYTYQPNYITGYYKYIPNEDDNAIVMCQMLAAGEDVGGNTLGLAPTSEWSYFELPLNYSSVPDECAVLFSTGDNPGSVLLLDDVDFDFSSDIISVKNQEFSIYPNPASDNVTITGIGSGDFISVNDLQGREVLSVQADSPLYRLNLQDLNKGIYLLKLSSKPDEVIKLIKEQ